jgi:hypothetical protein
LDLLFRKLVCHHYRRFEFVITVEIVTAKAGFPTGLLNQCCMRNIHRVIFKCHILVAVLAHHDRSGNPPFLMLAVTPNAGLDIGRLPGLLELGFHELCHRVAIVGVVMAGQALLITGRPIAKKPFRWRVALTAFDLFMARVIRSTLMQGLQARKKQHSKGD